MNKAEKTLLQQALDALQHCLTADWVLGSDGRLTRDLTPALKAIKALRQALEAEQQNKPVARSLTDELMDCVDRLGSEYDEVDPRVWDHLLAYAPKQQGEPVAWMFQHEETGLTEAVDVQQVEWGFEKNNPRWQKLFPLYTRPQPKRQPLTDAQIMAIGRELGLKCRLGGNPNIDFDYARAIERAHGIKEES